MKLTLQFADGTSEEVRPAPADLVRFERQYKMGAAKIDDDPRIEYLMFLAWASLHRTGRAGADFDEWLATLADIDSEGAPSSSDPPLPPPGE